MPTKIGRFEIQGQLSRSAFATVYKALDTETKQIIALKVVALNNLPDRDDLIKTVFEEADRSKPLNSHNIAVLYGVGDEEGQLLAGAEYVQGNSVATTLARKDGFSIWDLQDIARQICHALDHAQVHKVSSPLARTGEDHGPVGRHGQGARFWHFVDECSRRGGDGRS